MKNKWLNRSRESLIISTVGVSAITILSKLLGFCRETLIADYYGATAETDAFFFAQSMPSMVFSAISSSVSTAFISLYAARLARESTEDADRYASGIMLSCTLLSLGMFVVGIVIAPFLVPLLAPGFSGNQLTLTVSLSRLIMISLVLTMLIAMFGAVLNCKKHFVTVQLCGLLYSGTIITAIVFLGRGQRMETLTLVVLLGYFMHMAAMILCSLRCFRPTFRLSPFHTDTVELFRMSLPVMLGNAAYQLNFITDQMLGSLLPEGSLSALSYSRTLAGIVTSIFVTSLSTVLFPTLADDAAKGELESYGQRVTQSLTVLSWVLIPISLLTLLDARDVVSAVYARGSFDQTAVSYTGAALAGYAMMFLGTGIREILTRAFYARQNTRTPMHNTLISIGCNIALSILLSRYLGLAGIALGTTISCTFAACLLLRDTKRKLPFVRLSVFFSRLWRQLLAGAVMCAALAALHYLTRPLAAPFWRFALDTLAGFAVYLPVSLLLGGIKRR